MSLEPDIRDLLGPMLDREIDLESPEFRVDRERVVGRMVRAKSLDYGRRAGLVLATAAGVALALFGARRAKHETAFPTTGPIEVVVSEGRATQSRGATRIAVPPNLSQRMVAEGELETGSDSKAKIRTDDGLDIELGGRTRVAIGDLQSTTRRITLFDGDIHCNIPHRKADVGRSQPQLAFQVIAANVTVIDEGTVFTVSVDSARHTTRVSVEEGEVVVRQVSGDTRVRAPSGWTNAPRIDPVVDASVGRPELANAPPSAPEPTAAKTKSSGAVAPGVAPKAPPTLDFEARLLRQGLAAERQGRYAEATAALTQLITKYPQSPLVPDARAALSRLQGRSPR